MNIAKKVLSSIKHIVSEDKKNVLYLFYYSVIEAILVLSIPLTSSFIINSVLAHASISVLVLGFIVVIIFLLITALQIIKEYIIEKFQQKIFVVTAIEISEMAVKLKKSVHDTKETIDKYMNYFFDITSIQKFFPVLLLDGTGFIIKLLVSSVLLFAFNPMLFFMGLIFFVIYIVLILLLGRNGLGYAIERSDSKHNSIYYLQSIPYMEGSNEEILKGFDKQLSSFVKTRKKMFMVIIRQLSLTFFSEGFIFGSFLIIGGHLVMEGKLPLGEFVAAEIIVVSITYTLKSFMKQIDYIYDMVEGFYKVEKLSLSLKDKENE